jgi:hypothetical protein
MFRPQKKQGISWAEEMLIDSKRTVTCRHTMRRSGNSASFFTGLARSIILEAGTRTLHEALQISAISWYCSSWTAPRRGVGYLAACVDSTCTLKCVLFHTAPRVNVFGQTPNTARAFESKSDIHTTLDFQINTPRCKNYYTNLLLSLNWLLNLVMDANVQFVWLFY